MKRIQKNNVWMLLLFLGLSFTACMEDEDPIIEDPVATTPAAPSPTVGLGDGAFWGINAISTVTTPITLDTEIGTAVAFLTNDNFNSFVDAGAISVMDAALTVNENKSYVYLPGITQPLGLQYPSSYDWTVAGAGSVTGFTHTVDFPFPSLGAITSGNEVVKASGYTLTCQNVSRADSIIYIVGEAIKTVAGDVTSVEFTADDLKNVTTGSSFIQIAAYTYKPEEINNKTYYFGNETVRSEVVEIK